MYLKQSPDPFTQHEYISSYWPAGVGAGIGAISTNPWLGYLPDTPLSSIQIS